MASGAFECRLKLNKEAEKIFYNDTLCVVSASVVV
jgi:hypothetical protein